MKCISFLQACLIATVSAGCTGRTSTISSVGQSEIPSCIGPFTCDGEVNICRATTGGVRNATVHLSDETYSVRSDGRGSYRGGIDGVGAFAGAAVVLYWRQPPADTAAARYITVDLDQPVPDGGGVPLGVIRDSYAEVAAQWFAEPAWTADSAAKPFRLQHSVLEMPVGATVEARQINIGVHIDGRYHILQMGPQPTGHCFAEGTAIHGQGTTPARITRLADSTWVVEARPGSVARLFDTYHTNKYAVDRGLYYISFRYTVGR